MPKASESTVRRRGAPGAEKKVVSSSSSKQFDGSTKKSTGILMVIFIIAVWYGTSCLATTGTKVIMKMKILAPEELLLFQMGMTVFYLRIFGWIGIVRFNFTLSYLWKLRQEILMISCSYLIFR